MADVFGRIAYRIGQVGRGLVPGVPARDRALAAAILTEPQFAAFRLLDPADQRHALRVVRLLLAAGARDPDLIVAGLLHDLGKVDARGEGRVLLIHRVAKVLLVRLLPGLWVRLGDTRRPGLARGFALLRHHPALGAAWAATLGVSPRACALIAAHQAGPICPGAAAALRQLRHADDRA
jgi:hypothetical protein